TDSFSQHLFNRIAGGNLVKFCDFENRDAIFPSVHRSYKFCLLTIGQTNEARFVCFATKIGHLSDERRQFALTPEDFSLLNPNTTTCPIFRTKADAELTKKIYQKIPILVQEKNGERDEVNPW